MIKYSLICDTDHGFEAWFKNSDAFRQQLESGILSCPVCGSDAVRKALMAPSVRSTKGREVPPEPQAEVLPPEPKTPSPEQAQQIQMMTKAAELKRQLLALRTMSATGSPRPPARSTTATKRPRGSTARRPPMRSKRCRTTGSRSAKCPGSNGIPERSVPTHVP